MLQPDTVSQTPVSRHLTVPGFTVPSYPVAHDTLAASPYVVAVKMYAYPVVAGSLQSEMYGSLVEIKLLLCRLSCETQVRSFI